MIDPTLFLNSKFEWSRHRGSHLKRELLGKSHRWDFKCYQIYPSNKPTTTPTNTNKKCNDANNMTFNRNHSFGWLKVILDDRSDGANEVRTTTPTSCSAVSSYLYFASLILLFKNLKTIGINSTAQAIFVYRRGFTPQGTRIMNVVMAPSNVPTSSSSQSLPMQGTGQPGSATIMTSGAPTVRHPSPFSESE